MRCVSIIIPVYNGEEYIEKCIDSIINQSFKEIEIIVVDDGSIDNTYKVVQEKMNKDKRIKLFHKQNGGVSSARNMGIEQAIGEYIMFVDADDYIKEGCLEYIVNTINTYSNSDWFCYDTNKLNEKEGEYKSNDILKNMMLTFSINPSWNKIYKKSIIEKYNLKFDDTLDIFEDLLFNIDYIKCVDKVYISKFKYYVYRNCNNNSLTKKYSEDGYNKLMYVNDTLRYKLLKDNENKELEYMLNYFRIKNIFASIMFLFHNDCNYKFKDKWKKSKQMIKDNPKLYVKGIGIRRRLFAYLFRVSPHCVIIISAFIMHELRTYMSRSKK